MEPKALSEEEITSRLQALTGWSYEAGSLHKKFVFAGFTEAWNFMGKVAKQAEAMNHHPDWSNVYNTVTINLSTHDAGGVSELDFELADRIESSH